MRNAEGRRSSSLLRVPRDVLERWDRQLVALGRGAGALRLRLGEALEVLASRGGHHELGFSTVGAYAQERCERSGRWAADSRAMARRLAERPLSRRALSRGEISWSVAELLGRGPAEDEEALLAEARGLTVRALRERLAGEREPEVGRSTLCTTVDREEYWVFQATRKLIATLDGTPSLDVAVEAMLAEASTELIERRPDLDIPVLEREAPDAWREQVDTWRRQAEEDCEANIPPALVEPLEAADEPLPNEPLELDGVIRQLAAEMATRDLALGEVARRLFEANGWRRLGYASEYQYVRERVGVSHASVKARMTLSRRVEALPEVGEALVEGQIGFEAAQLVARVARPETVARWLTRAVATQSRPKIKQ